MGKLTCNISHPLFRLGISRYHLLSKSLGLYSLLEIRKVSMLLQHHDIAVWSIPHFVEGDALFLQELLQQVFAFHQYSKHAIREGLFVGLMEPPQICEFEEGARFRDEGAWVDFGEGILGDHGLDEEGEGFVDPGFRALVVEVVAILETGLKEARFVLVN